ncbi:MULTISPECIES: hypothetical protein [Bacteroides]|uniref:hypothetical protein n=1 Tax=Bacteroides TaxID=816 RepID=UPI0011C4869D|nr:MULTISPECIES: hypothetical protein [Bacteroides]
MDAQKIGFCHSLSQDNIQISIVIDLICIGIIVQTVIEMSTTITHISNPDFSLLASNDQIRTLSMAITWRIPNPFRTKIIDSRNQRIIQFALGSRNTFIYNNIPPSNR